LFDGSLDKGVEFTKTQHDPVPPCSVFLSKNEKKKVPMVGERSLIESELEMKLRRRLLLPTAESPIKRTLKE